MMLKQQMLVNIAAMLVHDRQKRRKSPELCPQSRCALGCWLQLPALGAEAPDANTRVAYVKMAQLWLECAYQIEFKSVNIPARVARNARASDCRPRAKVQDSSLKLV